MHHLFNKKKSNISNQLKQNTMKKTITTIVAAAMALALIHTVSCSKTEPTKKKNLQIA